jgi:lysozyme
VVSLASCATGPTIGSVEQASTACATGPTVNGIDVSYYDDAVDWPTAKAAGIDFAFVRVTDGTQYQDPKFADYWAGARAAGVIRGAYQYFRPSEDPIAQADLLLQLMGPLQPGDLPPVLDLEVSGGLTPAEVTTNVQAWIAHITAAIGRPPIVYAGLYSWPTLTDGADVTTSPLWIAQYTTAACPDIPDPWTQWLFWQDSDTGVVDGVTSSQLDLDVFNGSLADLQAFTVGGAAAPCGIIAASGGTIDDSDPCFTPGGPSAFMRHATDAGNDGDLYWTHTTDAATEANYGLWTLDFAAAGTYLVETYTAAAYATSKQATYVIEASGTQETVTIDQTAVDGWQSLGDIAFAAGGSQSINLGDNTGETAQQQLVFDAVRFTPLDRAGSGSDTPPDPSPPSTQTAGCSTTTGGGGLAVVLALGFVRRRRR